MPTTYALVLRPPRRDGLCPVHLRLISDRKALYRAVPDVAVSAKHWNEAGTLEKHNWVRGTHPYQARYNEQLRQLMVATQKLLDDNPTWSARQVRAGLNGGAGDEDLLAYMRLDVERRRHAGHPRTAEKFLTIHNKLQSHLLGIPHPKGRGGLAREPAELQARRAALQLPFAQFTVAFVRGYEQYLAGLGNRETTLNKELEFLRTVLNRAVEEDKLPEAANPFKRIRLKEGKARPKARLLDDEVRRLEALPAEALTAMQLRARDAWLLQYYLLGARVGDAVCLRWRDVRPDEVSFTEHKTGKPKLAARPAGLNAVLARHAAGAARPDNFVLPFLEAAAPYADFPPELSWAELARLPAHRERWKLLLRKVESATASINEHLKAVARLAGIDKNLTSHTARHSFADRGRRRGVPTADLRDMLNHHSIAQTEAYLGELAAQEIKDKSRSIYDE